VSSPMWRKPRTALFMTRDQVLLPRSWRDAAQCRPQLQCQSEHHFPAHVSNTTILMDAGLVIFIVALLLALVALPATLRMFFGRPCLRAQSSPRRSNLLHFWRRLLSTTLPLSKPQLPIPI
jgi:hypothetical protein